MTDADATAERRAGGDPGAVGVAVLLAPAVGRMTVDPVTGAVERDDRGATMSAADAAALEVALGLGEAWDVPVSAWSVGGASAETVLRDALAVGVDRAVRVDLADDAGPAAVAAALAEVLAPSSPAPFVVAGVHGADLGSAAVPAFLAHHLGAEQALGLVEIRPGEAGHCEAVRRVDRGARERVAVAAPAVISVEGSVARLRRAGLPSLLGRLDVEVVQAAVPVVSAGGSPRPWRPRARVVPGPVGASALERIRDLTGVAEGDRGSRTVEADPAEAAEIILDQLGEWGYGPRATVE